MAMQTAGQRVALAVGILILAIGGVVVLTTIKNKGEQARHDDTVKIAEEQRDTPPVEKGANDSKDDDKTSSDKKDNAAQNTSSEDKTSANQQQSSDTDSDVAALELPQTGTKELFAAIPVGLVTFALIGYIQSRRVS